jgi:hypothetical protein
MKSAYKIFLPFAFILFIYSSCKKADVEAPQQTTDNTDAISKQVAMNIYRSLSSQYGGTNINEGIPAPTTVTFKRSGITLFGKNPMCGYTVDTAFNIKTASTGINTLSSGHFKFIYTCSNNSPDGYIVADSLTVKNTGTGFSNTSLVAQNFVVKALDQSYRLLAMGGTIGTAEHTSKINSSNTVVEYHDQQTQYTLNGVKVDVSDGQGDIVTGTAAFTGTLSYLDQTTGGKNFSGGYAGTITFLSNYQAKLTITIGSKTKTYSVNMKTGLTTPI